MAWNKPGDDKEDKGNDNDPWKHHKERKNNQPPDLDEMFKKAFKNFLVFFGGKSNKSNKFGDGPVASSGKLYGWVIGLIVLAIIVIWALSGIFIVKPAEQGVVLRFGKYIETVGPGPHWIPRIFESDEIVNIQKIDNFNYQADMLTEDENIVNVQMVVQFRVDNAKDFLFNLPNPIVSLQQATASTVRQIVGNSTLNDVLTTGRTEIRDKVFKELKTTYGRYNAGIEITDVVMQPAKPPEEVKSAFDDAIKAQEDELRYVNQAEAYASTVMPKAEGQAKRLTAEAKAYQEETVLKAKGNISRFLALLPQYNAAPKVMRERLYLDTVQSVLTHSSKIIVDSGKGSNLLYLPLDKLMAQNQAATSKLPTVDLTDVAKTIASKVSTDTSRMPMTRENLDRYDYSRTRV